LLCLPPYLLSQGLCFLLTHGLGHVLVPALPRRLTRRLPRSPPRSLPHLLPPLVQRALLPLVQKRPPRPPSSGLLRRAHHLFLHHLVQHLVVIMRQRQTRWHSPHLFFPQLLPHPLRM